MNADARHRLEGILDNELRVAQELVRTLEEERAALTGNSPDAVAAQASAKLGLLAQLEELERSRRALCDERDLVAADGLAARWRSLLAVVSNCRRANEVNGYIINVRRNQVQQLIDIVRGAAAPLTYGPGGRATARAVRGLVRA